MSAGLALTLGAYLLITAAAVLTQALAIRHPEKVPSFADGLLAAMRTRSAALGLVIAWWWLGWHFITGA